MSNRRGERSLAGSRAFQLAEARFQCADTGGERRSRRRLIACNQGFQSAHTPAQSHAQDGADDTGNRDEQERRNHEDPEQIFQGRDPRAAAFGETSFESNRLSSARVLEKTPPAHRPGSPAPDAVPPAERFSVASIRWNTTALPSGIANNGNMNAVCGPQDRRDFACALAGSLRRITPRIRRAARHSRSTTDATITAHSWKSAPPRFCPSRPRWFQLMSSDFFPIGNAARAAGPSVPTSPASAESSARYRRRKSSAWAACSVPCTCWKARASVPGCCCAEWRSLPTLRCARRALISATAPGRASGKASSRLSNSMADACSDDRVAVRAAQHAFDLFADAASSIGPASRERIGADA